MHYHGASMSLCLFLFSCTAISRRLVHSSVIPEKANMFTKFSLRNSVLSLSVVLMPSVTSLASSSAFADTVALQANLQPSSEVPPREQGARTVESHL